MRWRSRRWRSWPPPLPGRQDVRRQPRRRTGRARTGCSMKPVSTAHQTRSRPPSPAWHPRSAATGKKDIAAGLEELLGDLAAGLAAPDDQDPSGGQAQPGYDSPRRRGCRRSGGKGGRAPAGRCGRWYAPVATTTGRRGARRPRLKVKPPSASAASDVTSAPLADRRTEGGGVASQMADDLIAEHESVGIEAVVGAAGQLDRPVRRHQAEAVPAPAPRLPTRPRSSTTCSTPACESS